MIDLIGNLFEGRLTSAIRRRRLGRDRFDCGVRVLTGQIPGEGSRWRHRISHVESGNLWHGSRVKLRVQIHKVVPHPGGWNLAAECIVFEGEDLDHGARLEIACMAKARKYIEHLRTS